MAHLFGRWREIGALVCVGAVVAGGAVGVAHAQRVGEDVVGGWASDRMLIRVREGVKPVRLADGRWTVKAVAVGEGAGGARALRKAERASDLVAEVGKRRGVVAIEPAIVIAPLNKALAKLHGLDRYYVVRVPAGSDVPGMVKEFTGLGELIELAHVESIGSIAGVPNDASFNMQWDMHNVGQGIGSPPVAGVVDADVDGPECWDVHQGSGAVILAMLDTGVQHFQANVPGSVDHPELAGRVITGWNTRDENDNTTDQHGHGTHCTGIAAATGNNGVGVAGMNWNVMILAMRVTDAGGGAMSTDCAEAVTWATDHGADVISMSLAFLANPLLESAVAYAYDSGVLPVAASGNNGSPVNISYPAKYAKCMAIGATNNLDVKWTSSNGGPELDVVAPGVSIYNLSNNSGYSTRNGTSMATPHVSGLAALMKSYNPKLSVAEIEQIIRDTAEDKGAAGFDNLYGWGRLNAAAAIEAATPGEECVGDVTGDGTVNVADLLAVIGAWGACADPDPGNCAADVAPIPDGDGVVNVNDLLGVIGAWGDCDN